MQNPEKAMVASLAFVLLAVELQHAGEPHVPEVEPVEGAVVMRDAGMISPTGVLEDGHVWTLGVDELGIGTILG